MIPLAQWPLDHRLDGAVEGQGVCLIGSGRGSLLRPLLAISAYCAHAGVPLGALLFAGGGALLAEPLFPLGSWPFINAL